MEALLLHVDPCTLTIQLVAVLEVRPDVVCRAQHVREVWQPHTACDWNALCPSCPQQPAELPEHRPCDTHMLLAGKCVVGAAAAAQMCTICCLVGVPLTIEYAMYVLLV